ncbi:MAG: alanine--tRNA ligase [Candidatus Zapsychrus exili]|nr:alanine--tRNA ligase [Candidatus Zapsychrus exili]
MKTKEIRAKFLKFFESKKHKIIASDSLVPKDDPTVLFTTAGMQQFKQQFLGNIDDFKCATTSQKCLRTDDLTEVGKTDFHHTFFEMLGNFSFGDYFKKEAISFAWEFLTKELGIDKNRLWVSVYKDDEEAEKFWLKNIKIPKEKLFKLGDKSNFWPSNAKLNGPNGPCGSCSEIFFDYNPEDKTIPSDPDDIPGRFSEVWNLVFTQFERKEGGELVPLPNKNIDTGMGLERLAAVMQGKKNNFETDIFAPILKSIEEDLGIKDIYQRNVIADHMRAICFGIADGVIPSNEGRGYVIKKLIITATDIAIANGHQKPVIFNLVDKVVETMKDPYSEIEKKSKDIAGMIKDIEQSFIKVCKEKVPELIDKYKILKDKVYDSSAFAEEAAEEAGELAFKFKDTYGLPINMIIGILEKQCGLMDEEKTDILKKYDKLMAKQQNQSRATSKMTGDVFKGSEIKTNSPKTNFLGHKHANVTGTVLGLFVNNKTVPTAKQGENVKIVLDKSSFYAESGGQIGDTGTITKDKVSIKITDTQKINDVFIHIGVVESGNINVNDQIKAEIDLDRRLSIMRNHTATHLLQAALREVLGSHVQQQGSSVDNERLRFDFTHHKALLDEEIEKIEDYVNNIILSCCTVTKDYMSTKEAVQNGALAFFAEKYGETVRVISIGNTSKELCGGTHLDSTGQIGLFKIVSESAIAQGIRRIEAKTGLNALRDIKNQEKQLLKISRKLKAPADEIVGRVSMQSKKIKELEKELEKYRFETIKESIDSIVCDSESVGNTKIITHCFKNADMGLLRKVSDIVKQKAKSSIIALGSSLDDNAYILLSVSDDIIKKDIKANEIIKEIAVLIDGSGGGSPKLAQAGSKEASKVNAAIQKSKNIIKEMLKP